MTGSSPPPVINFSLTMIDEEHAVMFGGCLYKSIFSADVYILNLLTMVSYFLLTVLCVFIYLSKSIKL